MAYVNHNGNRGRGHHSNGGQEDFTFYGLGWENAADVTLGVLQYQDIDETTDSISINVRDPESLWGKNSGGLEPNDGNDSIVFTIDDPNYSKGFAQEVYIFTEEEAKNNGGQIQKDIPLVDGSDIKAVTIIIEDNDPGKKYNLTPIEGTPGADKLDGTAIGDAIYGYEGNDYLHGKKGEDSIYGFAGNDTLKGGDDKDLLYGNSGKDRLYGGSGDDILDGGTGNDKLYGGDGSDRLFGWYGNDILEGGSGNDQLYGEKDNDVLKGGSGNDILDGGAGKDKLYGGKDNDELYGGKGDDILHGGSGLDSFIFKYKDDGIDTIKNFNISEDKIVIEKDTFGATSLDQFIYNSSTGTLYFNANTSSNSSLNSFTYENPITTFAILENKPAGFSVNSDITLI
ncbi:MAG: calcium-binding protein [Mastigocoleus sp.]